MVGWPLRRRPESIPEFDPPWRGASGVLSRENPLVVSSLTMEGLKRLIIESLQLEGMAPENLEDDQALVGDDLSLGLDSVDILELVVAIEKQFGVRIRSQQVSPEDFESIRSLYRLVESKINAPGESTA